MRKFLINEEEQKRILNLHTREKDKITLLSEQVTDKKSQLKEYIDTGCISEGTLTSIEDDKGNLIPAIKKMSKKVPGRVYFFFADFTYGYFDAFGKFIFEKNKWECKENWSVRKEIEKLKKEQKWMEKHETGVSDSDLSNTKKWETYNVPGSNVTLYRRISQITATEDLGVEAKQLLDKLRADGYMTADEVPAYLKVEETKISELVRDWDKYFSDDISLFFDPKARKREINQKPEDIDTTKEFNDSLKLLTRDGCILEIEEFYNNYVYDVTGIASSELKRRRTTVQYCARKFDFNNVIYRKTRKRLFALAGYSTDEATGTPAESPYRIKLPPNYKP